MRSLVLVVVATLAISMVAGPAEADKPIILTIKDHQFQPEELRIPAGKRVVITFVNNDPTPEEFDSSALKVEKVVAGNSKGTIRIGPLTPGRYKFIGEYHADTAKGVVVAE